ncbi:hypothetical protein K488DRAFT_70187 [Vararia minispora EC-137]|uniref:Uncharacterized protein n=1 Tax=Vararia minispora EC-137 TaxID=1314806 RepID=A0ACB8QMR8_9AGAM|nr:hypothetical protein K488DRAFT_70187 [Vararia minispora EC-137]
MSSLSAADALTLKATGQDIIRTFVAIVVETFLYVIVASRSLLKATRRAAIALFGIVVTMFMLDTVLWIFDIHDFILEVSTVLTSSKDNSLQDRYRNATDASLFPLVPIFYTFMTVLGDIIIIWRVFAFWMGPRERRLLVIPLTILTASIVTLFMIIDCSVRSKGQLLLGNFDSGAYCSHVQTASYLANTLTTLVSTIMISYKTWVYRRTIKASLSEPSSRVERVMIILVESGIIYFLFFLEVFIASLGDITQRQAATPSLAFASTVYIYTISHVVGIYPTVIVILVHHQKSYIDTTAMHTSITFSSDTTTGRGTVTIGGSTTGASRRYRRSNNCELTHLALPVHELRSNSPTGAWNEDGRKAALVKETRTV